MQLADKAAYVYPRLRDPIARRTFGKIFLGIAAGGAGVIPLMMQPRVAEAARTVDCATYMFHLESAAVVSRTIAASAREGRVPVSASQLVRIIRDEEPAPGPRLFCLTFDDGLLTEARSVVPMLQRLGIPGTFFVLDPGSWWGDRVHAYVGVQDIQAMAAGGMDIQSHGISHQNLTRIQNSDQYWADIYASRAGIAQALGETASVFCYPFGAYNSKVQADVIQAGYSGAFSTTAGNFNTPDMLYRLLRKRPT